ncbi:MAG: monovalent cation:H+ antiporter-2, family [Thermoplasmata archaeon]|jgi:CPA2 family monovalent cation:H+ antiporter-2|nr:monovalent cation:H+ antiporter-2, family [Thermoplasmata archaeon]
MDAVEVLTNLSLLATALAAAGWLSHRLRLPPALGYLLVGAASASALGRFPGVQTLLPPAAEISVLFLLFAIGLELDLKRLREILRKGAVTLPLDVLVPALLVTGAARLAGWEPLQSIALGLALSLSSTLFGERLAGSANFPLPARQRTLGVLLAEDVAAVALVAIIAILGNPTTGGGGADWLVPLTDIGLLLFLFVLLTAGALLVVPRVLDAVARTHAHDLLVLVGTALVIAFGALGLRAGSAELGALVAGVAAAEAGSRFVLRNSLQSIREIGLAVFFFVSGVGTDLGTVAQHPFLVLALGAMFLASKLVVHVPAALASGLSVDAALRGGLALGTVGEFSLIIAATAAQHGLAHPLMIHAVVGTMLLLLVVAPVLLQVAPALVRVLGRTPERFRRPLGIMVHGLRHSKTGVRDRAALQQPARLLAANLILLAALLLLGVTLGPTAVERFPDHPFLAPVLAFGVPAAVAVPLVWGTYRNYRELVHRIVGLEKGGQDSGARLRARLMDAWVALTIGVLLIPVGLLAPRALPVLLGGMFVAIIIATLAWRQLARFHLALESTVTRVLGQDPEASALLDRVMERYPWGVRFAAVAIPTGSPLAGQRLREARVSELTGASVAMLQRRGRETINPSPDLVLHAGDTLVLMGDVHQLEKAETLVVAHGEAIRLSAQSRLAAVAEVDVRTGSSLVGTRLGEADFRGRTGTLVIGVWTGGAEHPMPYRGDLVLAEGDRLILLGAPLQVERARLLAEGVEHTSTVEAVPEPV